MSAETCDHTSWQTRVNACRAWLPAVIAGCGFCLAFGWVWFAALFARVVAALPGVFSGTLLSGGGISAFSLALFAGFITSGLWAHRLPAWRAAAWLAHGGALVCVVGGLAMHGAAPSGATALLGLGAACSGVYWTARLLVLPPIHAGIALTIATLLAWGLSPVYSTLGPTLVLPVGLILAMGLSMLRNDPKYGVEQAVHSMENAETAAHPEKADWLERLLHDSVLPIVLLSFTFFAAGLLAPAAPAPSGASLPVAAAGTALAAACCSRLRDKGRGASLLALAMVLPAALLLTVLPGLSGTVALFGACMEGAALVALTALRKEGNSADGEGIDPAEYSRAGFYLATVFCLINLGGVAGAAIIRSGDSGGWLFAVVCTALCPPFLLLAAAWRNRARREAVSVPPEQTVESPESVQPSIAASSQPSALWSRLTRRECAVSELLLRDKSNPEICSELFVTENTVRTHIKNIYHKTGAASRDELKNLLREGK